MEETRQPKPDLDFYLLIPFYNNLPGLTCSLQSVCYPAVKYSLLIVDDGSATPLLRSDLGSCLPPEVTVQIIRLPLNMGITKALNAGLEWLKWQDNFKYIARLDCGDLCDQSRFARQVEFLEGHPDIDLVGSWCIFKDFSSGSSYQYSTPTGHEQITRGMYFRNIFIHPTVMWRFTVLGKTGIYPERFPYAEDYGFFYEIISKSKAAVLPENLVICEINPKGLSLRFRKEQLKSRRRVVREFGRNKLFSFLGVVKLWILMVIPYGLLFQAKKLLYGIKVPVVIEP
jgi:glycosyltransferase involved in cell wall biosynthesis